MFQVPSVPVCLLGTQIGHGHRVVYKRSKQVGSQKGVIFIYARNLSDVLCTPSLYGNTVQLFNSFVCSAVLINKNESAGICPAGATTKDTIF